MRPIALLACCMHGLVMTACAVAAPPQQSAQLGPVQLQVTVEPESPRIGDVITLTIRVTAEPDVEVLMPEFGEALDQFAILDFVPQEKLDDQGRMVHLQKYTLQPAASGMQRIPPILVEFLDHRSGSRVAPEGEDAYELATARLDFTVASVAAAEVSALLPPLGTLQPLPTSSIPAQAVQGSVIVLLALCAAALVMWWLVRRRTRVVRMSPYEIAQGRLQRLIQQPIPHADQIAPFFVELSALVREYLENRFELRAPELTTEEFLELASRGSRLAPQHQSLLRDFLKRADLVKFAGWQPDEQVIRQALQAAERFLQETRDDETIPTADSQPTLVTSHSAGESHD